MNHYLTQTITLLSGQAAPFTGEVVNVARAKDLVFDYYVSGNGSITLQYKSPFFENQWIDFNKITANKVGPVNANTLGTPTTLIRAISTGIGSFWCAVTVQN